MDNKTLLILGASSDMGCSLIENSIDKYDTIICHYLHMNDRLKSLKEKYDDKMVMVQADFSDELSIAMMIEQIKKNGYKPTHIVHLPCLPVKYERFEKISNKDLKKALQISLFSFIQVTQAFIADMRKNKYGKIVVMLTVCTIGVPPKFMPIYVTEKYALLGMVKALASDYADKGIQINAVSPEMVDTKFLREIPDFVKQQTAEQNPLKRILKVEDVVPTITYLLSEEAACITGQNIAITAGK